MYIYTHTRIHMYIYIYTHTHIRSLPSNRIHAAPGPGIVLVHTARDCASMHAHVDGFVSSIFHRTVNALVNVVMCSEHMFACCIFCIPHMYANVIGLARKILRIPENGSDLVVKFNLISQKYTHMPCF